MMMMPMMMMMMPMMPEVERREIYCLPDNPPQPQKQTNKQNKTKQNKTKQNKIFFMKLKEYKRLLFNKNISQTRCPDLQKTTKRFPTVRIGHR